MFGLPQQNVKRNSTGQGRATTGGTIAPQGQRSGHRSRFVALGLTTFLVSLVVMPIASGARPVHSGSSRSTVASSTTPNGQRSIRPQTLSSRKRPSRASRATLRAGCWMEIYAGADYAAPRRRIMGPISLMGLNLSDKNWNNKIHSIKTGPTAWARVYKEPNFQGVSLLIPPNTSYRSLRPFAFKDAISSIMLRTHSF